MSANLIQSNRNNSFEIPQPFKNLARNNDLDVYAVITLLS